MPDLNYFCLGAWFPSPIDKAKFMGLYEYLLNDGLNVVYEPEINARSVTLRLEKATISFQNKRCVVWHKNLDDGKEVAKEVVVIMDKYLNSTFNTTD